jgi:hypothetical protein
MIHELSLHPEVEKRLRLGSGARPPQALRRSRPAHVSYPQTCDLRPLRPADTSHGSSDRPAHRIHSTRRRPSWWQTTEAG